MAHPLDPLDTNELERAVAIARDVLGLGEGVRFIEVGLDEPEKAAVLTWREGGPAPPRQATLTLLDNATGEAEVAVVLLDAGEVVCRTPIAEGQPAMSIDEFVEGGEAVKADPGYRASLAGRGIGDDQLDLVHVEPWTVGDFEGGERPAGPGDLLASLLGRRSQPLRAADRRPAGDRRPEHDAGRAH